MLIYSYGTSNFININFKVLMSPPNFQARHRLPRTSSHSIFVFHWRCKNSWLYNSGFTPLNISTVNSLNCNFECSKFNLNLLLASKYLCPRCKLKNFFLLSISLHFSEVLRSTSQSGSSCITPINFVLAPGSSTNQLQNCFDCLNWCWRYQ